MRYWDELSIIETALAMSCSEGSVKTTVLGPPKH